MDALARRRSSREFSSAELPRQLLSNLLWAAFGINRAETNGRTAPSARDAQEIDVYAALPGGVYIYDAFAHSLSLVAAIDARNVTGYQDFVDEAALGLVYVADHAHTGGYTERALRDWAHKVRRWRAEGRDVHVYFDNDAYGDAPRNAARLIALMSGRG